MLLKRSKVVLLFPLLFVAGCSSVGDTMSKATRGMGDLFVTDSQSMKVTSEPAGADVYVMGQKVGVTPLTISQQAIFPMQYDKEKESSYGKVTIKKGGCQDMVKPVSAKDLSLGMKVRLDCGDLAPAVGGGTNPQMRAVPGAMPRLTETVEQRLKHIKDLQDQGLINEEEAKAARARVLGDL